MQREKNSIQTLTVVVRRCNGQRVACETPHNPTFCTPFLALARKDRNDFKPLEGITISNLVCGTLSSV